MPLAHHTTSHPNTNPNLIHPNLNTNQLADHHVFTIYRPSITFTSDSGATDILVTQRNASILTDYTPFVRDSDRPGFSIANLSTIYPIATGRLDIPYTSHLCAAYSATHTFFRKLGHHTRVQVLDNEALAELYTYFDTHRIAYQLVPPANNRNAPSKPSTSTSLVSWLQLTPRSRLTTGPHSFIKRNSH